MHCPNCKKESQVIDTREAENSIRRRRACLDCQHRFTTYERIEIPKLMVIKRDGRRESFSREKLGEGIRKACEKRPVCLANIEQMVDDIERELNAHGEAEVPSLFVGELVMSHLKALDGIAYIRFASVYRQFTDIRSLEREVKKLVI
jgi:transcriptional repressor NrdR